ncbi:MAG: amidohydrolase, partial [Brevundimonas sp.]|nr:amidohydrolase [Brevundimonas sp.]
MKFHALRGSSLATLACALAGSLVLSACATTGDGDETPGAAGDRARSPLATGLDSAANPDPFPSTYRGLPRENMAIVGG